MSLDRRCFVAAAASGFVSAFRPDQASGAPPEERRDPLGVRDDFPVVAERVYLNSAYIAPVHRAVIAACQAHVEAKSRGALQVGGLLHSTGVVRAQFARLIHATPEEIGLLFSTGDGENVIANGVGLKGGDNVVVDDLHYSTEFVLYRALEASRGIELRIVKNRDGAVTAADFEPHVDRRTRIVSVAWVSNQNGFVHEMRPIADLAHAHGAIFYADAVQAAGMIDLDVRAAGVDALCSGSYKWLMSEFGVAPFFVSRDAIDRIQSDRTGEFSVVQEEPDHHYRLLKNAGKFEGTSRSFGAVAQLQASLAYLEKVGIPRIEKHTVELAQQLYEGLVKQGYRMFTPPGNRSSIVTFYFTRPAADFRAAFSAAKIDVTVRAAQVRVSPALFNNAEEIDRLLEITRRLSYILCSVTQQYKKLFPLRPVGIAAFLLASLGVVWSQNPGVTRTIVHRADVSVPGREAIIARAEIAPGAHVGRHTHPGEEISYVMEGEGEILVDGKPTLKVKTGDGFVIPNGAIHDARNTGSVPLKLAVVYLVEKGKPVATPVP